MNLQRFEPFSLISVLNRDLDRFAARRTPAADWLPAVDVVEEKERFVLRADLPGVSRDAIDLHTDDGLLTITGERQREPRDNTDGVRRFERAAGKFVRRFALPDSADTDGITARSSNGILEVVIPKKAEIAARRIAVEAA